MWFAPYEISKEELPEKLESSIYHLFIDYFPSRWQAVGKKEPYLFCSLL